MNINFYLDQCYKPGISKEDVRVATKKGKPITKYLSTKETSIYLILSFPGRKLVKVRIPEKIRPTEWNFDTKLPKPTMYSYLELADRLSFLKSEVLKQYRAAVNKSSEGMSLNQVKELVHQVIDGKTPQYDKRTFLEVLDEFILERKNTVKKGTWKKYKSFKSIMLDYWKHKGTNANTFMCESINETFKRSFEDYLINQRKLLNNSIGKYFIILKVLMKWALEKEYHSSMAYIKFPTAREKVDVIYLSLEEIALIQKADLTGNPGLERCRDCFVFQIICGQRYSDLKGLRAGDFLFNSDNTVDLRIYQIKGNRPVSTIIPIATTGVDILKKYNVSKLHPEAPALPVISNQKYNSAIKDICEKAGITEQVRIVSYCGINRVEKTYSKFELISSHTARKTHVSVSVQSGVSIDIVSSVTGHSTTVMREHYLSINLETKRKAIDRVWGSVSDKS